MNLDDIFLKSYLQEFGEKEKKKILTSQEDRLICAHKRAELSSIEQFLQKFVDLEVVVNHCDKYTKNAKVSETVEPKKFNFYLVDSSKRWWPGISILFDHPAQVEIAIPNNIQEDGSVVIKVATHHPDAYILEQRFQNYEAACEALGKFLGRCTVSIGKDPAKYLNKDFKPKKISENFSNNLPDTPPEDKINTKRTQDLFNKKTTDNDYKED